MKIKDLIKELEKYDENTEIIISDGADTDYSYDRTIGLEEVSVLLVDEHYVYPAKTKFKEILKGREKSEKVQALLLY